MINLYESIFGNKQDIMKSANDAGIRYTMKPWFKQMSPLNPDFTVKDKSIYSMENSMLINPVPLKDEPDCLAIFKQYELHSNTIGLREEYNNNFKKLYGDYIYTDATGYNIWFKNINFEHESITDEEIATVSIGNRFHQHNIKDCIFDFSKANNAKLKIYGEIQLISSKFINIKSVEIDPDIYEPLEKYQAYLWKRNDLAMKLDNTEKINWRIADIKKFYKTNKNNIKEGKKLTPYYIWGRALSELNTLKYVVDIPSVQEIKLYINTYNHILFTKNRAVAEQYYTDVDQLLTPDGWYACLILK